MRPLIKTLPVLLAVILLAGISAQAESNIIVLFHDSPGPSNMDYGHRVAAAGDTLYIARRDGLYAYHVGDEVPKRLMDFTKTDLAGAPLPGSSAAPPAIAELMSENGVLYALDAGLSGLWRFEKSAPAFVREAAFDFKEALYGGEKDIYLYSSFMLSGGRVYCIARDPTASDASLMRFDIKSGRSELVKTGILMASPYAPDMLLVCTGAASQTETLSLLDVQTGRLDTKLSLSGDYKGLIYDPATGTAYLTRKGEIHVSCSFQAPVPAARMPILSSVSQGAALAGGHLALPYADGVRIYGTDPSALADIPLKIAGQTFELPMEDFSIAHPEVTFSFMEAYPENTASLVLHMMGGDSAADIYSLYLQNYNLDDLYEKRFFAGLEDSRTVADAIATMYPFLKDALMRDERIIAMPFAGRYAVYGYVPRAFEEVGLTEADLPATHEELLDFIVRWGEEYAEQYPSMSLFGQDLGADVCKIIVARTIQEDRMYDCLRRGGRVTYNTPEMRTLFEKLRNIDFDVIRPLMPDPFYMEYGDDPGDWPRQLFQLRHSASTEMTARDYFYYMPLKITEDAQPVVLANLQVLLINPYTQNFDAALKFVEFMAGHLPATFRADLMPGENKAISEEGIDATLAWYEENIALTEIALKEAREEEKRGMQDRLDLLVQGYDQEKRLAWQSTEESIAAFRALDPYFMLQVPNPLYGLSADQQAASMIYNRFLDGQTNVDQFLREIDQKLRMMELEN